MRGGNKMNNFAYYPKINKSKLIYSNDERFGGAFLLPFLTGAVVSAPFWYIGGSNKAQQLYQNQPYPYQNQPYPMYYPYQTTGQKYPYYYPYPQYK